MLFLFHHFIKCHKDIKHMEEADFFTIPLIEPIWNNESSVIKEYNWWTFYSSLINGGINREVSGQLLKHFHCESQLKEESGWRAGLRGWGGALEFEGRGLDMKWCGTPERRSESGADEECEEKNVVEVASLEGGAFLGFSGGGAWGREQSSLWLCGVCSWVCESASVWEGEACASSEDVVCVWVLQWEFRCRRSTAVRVNPFPQVSHTYGRSPVWERTWRWRSPEPAKHLPENIKVKVVHVITLKGFILCKQLVTISMPNYIKYDL